MKQTIKWISKIILRTIFKILYVCPIKRNRIIFSSFGGKQYTCNPSYIYRSIKKIYGDKFEYIWVIDKKRGRPCDFPPDDKLVSYNSLSYIYHCMTSRVLIFNMEINISVPIRHRRQLMVNTWHGGGAYKRVGLDVSGDKHVKKTTEILGRDTGMFLSSCKKFSKVMETAKDISKDKFVEYGMPRNDILINPEYHIDEVKKEVKKQLNIDENTYIILYAPTHRSVMGTDKEYEYKEIDVNKTRKALEKRFGGEYMFLYRAHTTFAKDLENREVENTLDVSKFNDMQRLLCATDVLITDYSSSIWDFSFTKRPCFLYTPDIKKYKQDRDFYTPIDKWPFPSGDNNDKLAEVIKSFDEGKYLEDIDRHHKDLGSFETGNASKLVGDLIYEKISNKKIK